MNNLTGFVIHVSHVLIGSKRVVKSGSQIWVSPAMHYLIQTSTQEKLRTLLGKIELVDIGEPLDFNVPMTTFPPSW